MVCAPPSCLMHSCALVSHLLDAFVCAYLPPAQCIHVRLSPTCSMHPCALVFHLLDACVCACVPPDAHADHTIQSLVHHHEAGACDDPTPAAFWTVPHPAPGSASHVSAGGPATRGCCGRIAGALHVRAGGRAARRCCGSTHMGACAHARIERVAYVTLPVQRAESALQGKQGSLEGRRSSCGACASGAHRPFSLSPSAHASDTAAPLLTHARARQRITPGCPIAVHAMTLASTWLDLHLRLRRPPTMVSSVRRLVLVWLVGMCCFPGNVWMPGTRAPLCIYACLRLPRQRHAHICSSCTHTHTQASTHTHTRTHTCTRAVSAVAAPHARLAAAVVVVAPAAGGGPHRL